MIRGSVAELAQEWEWFSRRVARGFREGLDDYLYYLNGRDAIEVCASRGTSVDDDARARIADADARFMAATREASRLVGSQFAPTGTRHFYARAPRIVLGELRTDLLESKHRDWVTRRSGSALRAMLALAATPLRR